MTRRFTTRIGALALAAVLLVACGGKPTAPPAAPAPAPTTPVAPVTPPGPSDLSQADLLEQAKKEGKVVWYTAVDLKVAESVAKAFETKYPGIKVTVERNGSERVFQKIGQEYQSNIKVVDVINSSDASHFVVWKRDGWLAKHVPPDVKQYYAPENQDKDGFYATWRSSLSVMGYNTKLVTKAEAPKSFADLLDPKWKGKIVKAHPGYSGTIVTATFAMARDIGWDYIGKLAKQSVMQQQSSTAPPKILATGERAVMADGNEYNMFLEKEKGSPVEIIYATEGSPFIASPSAVLKDAPNPHAARFFQNYLFTAEAQQLLINEGGLRSLHPQTKEKEGRTPLSQIKLMKEDPVGMEPKVEEIKAKYVELFGA